jgi:hypothetical protein
MNEVLIEQGGSHRAHSLPSKNPFAQTVSSVRDHAAVSDTMADPPGAVILVSTATPDSPITAW